MSTTCGTPGYVAPEILAQKGSYGREVDLWSLGVILYILLCGFPPFYDDNNTALYNQIKRGDYSFPSPYWDNVSKPAIDLIRKLLTVDPAARLTVEQALGHPWIKARDAHSSVNLSGAQEQLKKFNARRKFKNAVNTVVAVGGPAVIAGGSDLPRRRRPPLFVSSAGRVRIPRPYFCHGRRRASTRERRIQRGERVARGADVTGRCWAGVLKCAGAGPAQVGRMAHLGHGAADTDKP